MNRTSLLRTLSAVIAGSLLTLASVAPALAGGTSQGHGIHCYWVLVSSDPATGSNVYTQVCGRGV